MVFVHSAKVSRNYREAAKIIKRVQQEGAGVKTSMYERNNTVNRNNQRIYAIVAKVLEKIKIIDHLITTTEILTKEPRLDPWLARILIHELVWHKTLVGDAKPYQTVNSYSAQLKEALTSYKEDESTAPIKKVWKPKYVRVNTNKKSVEDVIRAVKEEGWILLPSGNNYSEYLKTVATLENNYFTIDYHIKDLLTFSNKYYCYNHDLYHNGAVTLQDKASCLAPYILSPKEGSVVLDMCAAPGMKTSQLAIQVGPKGRVYAIERNERRYQVLCDQMKKMDIKNVQCINKCALKITEIDFEDVEYILVDPSCSGTGMVDRIDLGTVEKDRIKCLSNFQAKILRYALSNFPKAQRVVYSTCSIYPEENEEVVLDVLKSVSSFKLVDLQERLKGDWFHFGSDKYGKVGTSCLYSKSEEDFTNGFFLALFERGENDTKAHYEDCKNTVVKTENDYSYGKRRRESNTETVVKVESTETETNNEVGESSEMHVKKKKKKKKDRKAEKNGE